VDPTQTAEESFSITIEDPTASEDIGLQRFNVPITITKIVGVLTGDYTSVTINPKFSTDRSAAGTAVLSAATAITSTTTGTVITSYIQKIAASIVIETRVSNALTDNMDFDLVCFGNN